MARRRSALPGRRALSSTARRARWCSLVCSPWLAVLSPCATARPADAWPSTCGERGSAGVCDLDHPARHNALTLEMWRRFRVRYERSRPTPRYASSSCAEPSTPHRGRRRHLGVRGGAQPRQPGALRRGEWRGLCGHPRRAEAHHRHDPWVLHRRGARNRPASRRAVCGRRCAWASSSAPRARLRRCGRARVDSAGGLLSDQGNHRSRPGASTRARPCRWGW